MKELVSIITPVYNGERFLAKTIESVIGQSYGNWEMLIVNDGSTDRSEAIASEYAAKDSRIRVINQPNGGSAAARNHGIREAEGRYIALLDGDDLWDHDFLEEQLSLMHKRKCVCVYSSYRFIDEAGNPTGKTVSVKEHITYGDMCVMNRIGCLTGLYDSKKFGKVFLREKLGSLRDDYAYWLDIVKLTGEAWGTTRPLASYRVMASSTTGKKAKLIGVQWRFYRKYLKQPFLVALKNLFVWGISGVLKFFI